MTNAAPQLDSVIEHLGALVACDTQNPPRELNKDSDIFTYLYRAVPDDFDIQLFDHGKGRLSFYACRGEPAILFNVHLDTVPALTGSKFPPHELVIEDNKVWGRGACDIKGAAACLLSVAQSTKAPMAMVFTTDEEGGEGCCVQQFIEGGLASRFSQIVVAEPTMCLAEFRHRGFLSARGHFTGIGGHSSEPRALQDNAIHHLAKWSAAAIKQAEVQAEKGLRSCFNIGTVEGGVKSNVIADHAHIFWSARLAPGESNDSFMEQCLNLDGATHAEWTVSFSGPPLPTAGYSEEPSRSFAQRHELTTGEGLDFWTEASLFGAAGLPALVLGPGNIEQAHVLDEWVSLEQLTSCLAIYWKLVNADV